MGKNLFLEEKQCITVLKQLLKANGFTINEKQLLKVSGASVTEDQLQGLLDVVTEQNPWFSDQGYLDLEVWERIGKSSKRCQRQGNQISLPSLTMWDLVRSTLAPLHTEDTSNVLKEKEGEL